MFNPSNILSYKEDTSCMNCIMGDLFPLPSKLIFSTDDC